MSDEMSTERTKLERWLAKKVDSVGFKILTDLINNGDKAALEAKMLELSKYAQGIENLRNSDQKLAEAKAKVAELNSTYKEDKAATEKRVRLIAIAISERFGDDIMDVKPTGI